MGAIAIMSALRRILPGGLRARLLVLVFAALLPALLLILDTAFSHMRHDEGEARSTALRLARIVAVDQEKTLESARTLLMDISRSPEVRASETGSKDAALANLLDLSPAISNLAIVDMNGHIAGSARPLKQPFAVSERTWFRRVLQSRAFEVGGYEISQETGQPELVVCTPSLRSDGRIRSVVTAWVDLQWIRKLIAADDLPAESSAMEIDRNGVILARLPDSQAWVGKSAADDPVFKRARVSRIEGSTRAISPDNIKRLWAYTPINLANQPVAYVAVGIPEDLAFANARRTLDRSLLLLLLATVIIACATWAIGDALVVRRVQALIRQANQVAAGDLSARTAHLPRPDELGQLEHAFDEMAASLQASEAQASEAEGSLRLSETRYKRLFDATPLPACVYEVESLAILNVNDAGIATYGYTRDEMLHMTIDQLFPRTELPEMQRALASAASTEQMSGTYRQIRKDGSVMEVQTVSHGLQFAGSLVRLVIAMDVTERNRTQKELLASVQQLRNLAQRLQTAREDERARVAREVHDELGQALTGLKLDVAALRNRTANNGDRGDGEITTRLADMAHLIDGAVQTVRRIATELRPAILDTLGLVPALEWQANDFQRRTGIPCQFQSSVAELRVGRDCATAVFRVFQEALTNVARHAKANRVTVRLRDVGGNVQLVVSDDGVGMPPERLATNDTFGICGMRERADLFGGCVTIESIVGEGTTVMLVLPDHPTPKQSSGAGANARRET